MHFEATSDIGQKALPPMVDHLKEDTNAFACLYVNFIWECAKWCGTLKKLLAKAKAGVDVIQLTGEMDKHEKFAFIRLFTSSLFMRNYNPRVLVATAAANTGIDQEKVDYVIRVGLPRCIITLLQERGRNARVAGMRGFFGVFTDWSLFVRLVLSILMPTKKEAEM